MSLVIFKAFSWCRNLLIFQNKEAGLYNVSLVSSSCSAGAAHRKYRLDRTHSWSNPWTSFFLFKKKQTACTIFKTVFASCKGEVTSLYAFDTIFLKDCVLSRRQTSFLHYFLYYLYTSSCAGGVLLLLKVGQMPQAPRWWNEMGSAEVAHHLQSWSASTWFGPPTHPCSQTVWWGRRRWLALLKHFIIWTLLLLVKMIHTCLRSFSCPNHDLGNVFTL